MPQSLEGRHVVRERRARDVGVVLGLVDGEWRAPVGGAGTQPTHEVTLTARGFSVASPGRGGGMLLRCSCPSSAAVPQKQRVAVLLSPSTKAEKPECNPTRGCAPRADQSTLLGGTAAVRSSWGTNYFWQAKKPIVPEEPFHCLPSLTGVEEPPGPW